MLAAPLVAPSSDWAPNAIPLVLPQHAAWAEATVWFWFPRPAFRLAAKWQVANAPPVLVPRPAQRTLMATDRLTSPISSACFQAGVSQGPLIWTRAVWLTSTMSSFCLASGVSARAKARALEWPEGQNGNSQPLASGEGLFLGFMSISEAWRGPQHWYTFPFPCLREALGLVAQLVRAHP